VPSHFGKRFDNALRRLRQGLPLGVPLEVKTVPPEKIAGLCGLCWTFEDPDKFEVQVSRELSILAAVDTLIHEYAHCLDHVVNGTDSRKEHRNSWGVAYAKCYRAVHKE